MATTADLDAALEAARSRRRVDALSRLAAWEARARALWSKLTAAQRGAVVRLLTNGGSLGVPEDVQRRTARALEESGLCLTFATGEYDPWGPYTFLALNDEVTP